MSHYLCTNASIGFRGRVRYAAAGFLTVLLAAAASAGNQPMGFLDVLRFRTVAQGTVSADGKQFAYTVSSLNWKLGKRFTDIYLTPASGGPTRQITFTTDKNEFSPAFSPDGSLLAFLSDRESPASANAEPAAEAPNAVRSGQLYLISISGGEARKISGNAPVSSFAFSRDGKSIAYLAGRNENRQIYLFDLKSGLSKPLTKHTTGIAAFAWSPDSSSLYFTAPDELDANEQKRIELKFDVRMVNRPAPPRHLWTLSVAAKEERRLTSGTDFTVSEFRVSKDGRWLTFLGNSTNRYIDPLDRRDTEAYLFDTSAGKLERLTDNKAPETIPVVSPDGRSIALTAPEDFEYFRRQRAYVRPIGGGAWKPMGGSTWDGDVREISWSADSKSLYFSQGVGVSEEVFAFDAASGNLAQLTKTGGVANAVYNAESGEFVIAFENPASPRDYFLASAAELARRDRWRRMSDANPQVENFALGSYETVQWKSSDGHMVEGLLVKPVGYQPGKRYPLIVQLHGGPAGAYINNFSASYGTYTHVFAAGGYLVLQPNYRGSTNYGEKFRIQIAGDYFRQGFDDIMTGVDDVIRRGIADPDKMGMMGWSAGGHWSNWTLTHTDRFKAISSGAGAVNWISMYAETDVHENREYYFKGTPYDNWDHYISISPLKYIKNAKTPTLIHVGHDDARVPRPQSEELHMALKKLGVPTEFIVYPRMGHGITEPRYQMVKMVSEYNWFEKWIKGKPGWFDWQDILDTLKSEATDDMVSR